MKKLLDWFRGYLRIRIRGAEPERCLNLAAQRGIPFWGTEFSDEFTVCVCVYRKDRKRLTQAAERVQCSAELCRAFGAPDRYGGLRRRLVLLAFLTAAAAAAVFVPKFVWFYAVEGNETVPTAKIVRAVQSVGVRFGSYGPDIHPQDVKNRVLNLIPELEWLTVTQNGGRAKIIVRERTTKAPVGDRRQPCSIAAVRSGVVTQILTMEGSPRVAVGQTVQEGQILISGVTELERTTRVSGAVGEVYARTWREYDCVTPDFCLQKRYTGEESRTKYLLIGKWRIKISGGSGISHTTCDKMTKREPLTLPEGLTLPIVLVTETCRAYEAVPVERPEAETEDFLRTAVSGAALSEMAAGEILETVCSRAHAQGAYRLHLTLSCTEMIGRTVPLEILTK